MTAEAVTTPARETATTADVLLRAADILAEFEWQQGAAGSRAEGSMCAVGAIFAAASDFQLGVSPTEACAINGYPASPCGIWPLAKWNDEPGRTKAEVVERLREAARVC